MGPRILAMDDDRAVLELLEDILTEDGYEVITSAHVVSADEIERLRPDLIIFDYSIGGSRWGKSRPPEWLASGSTDVPLVLCTTMPAAVRGSVAELNAKGVSLVEKPFGVDELSDVVRQALATRISPAPQYRRPLGGPDSNPVGALQFA